MLEIVRAPESSRQYLLMYLYLRLESLSCRLRQCSLALGCSVAIVLRVLDLGVRPAGVYCE